MLFVEIFMLLPKELQCDILKRIADESTEVISKCSFLLLLIQTNPVYAKDYGVSYSLMSDGV